LPSSRVSRSRRRRHVGKLQGLRNCGGVRPSPLCQHRQHRLHDWCLFSPSKDGLIASRPITAGSTDDADGADGIFSTRAHSDHSGPCPAFTRERDLDAQRPEECLRPPQPTGERPRIFCPCCAGRDVSASTLPTQTQEVGRAPGASIGLGVGVVLATGARGEASFASAPPASSAVLTQLYRMRRPIKSLVSQSPAGRGCATQL
jgi:hypothetical protein